MSVVSADAVGKSDWEIASLLLRDQLQQTCSLSSRDSSALREAQDSSQQSTGQECLLDTRPDVGYAVVQESSVLCADPVSFLIKGDGGTPITDQGSSSSIPAVDYHSGKNKSLLQDKRRARSLRYVPNWSGVAQRSLPPREIPRCHENAKEWPHLGSHTEELEVCYDHSVSNYSRTRVKRGVKPRFRNFCASSSSSSQDAKPVQVEENAVNRKFKKAAEAELRRGASCKPKLVMLNKDFIVTSPVLENLLVTIALTSQRRREDQLELAVEGPCQVLIGRFTAFSSFSRFKLCRDALRVKFEQNAGGTSTISESLSVEYFARSFQAQDVVTEMEVEYWSSNWKKVDYICTLYGKRVGVSVTRAMSYPDPNSFSTEIAYRLLLKKLYGLVVARDGVSARHSFCKCILHVWCETQRTAEIMKTTYAGVKKVLEISDDVIMVLTVADGSHARPIFYEHALHNH